MASSNKESLDISAVLKDNDGIIHKLSYMYSNNREEYKDLRQDICYQIIRSHKRFKGDSKLSTWVYKVSLFTALSFIKKKPKPSQQLDEFNDKVGIEVRYDEWSTIFQQIKKFPELDRSLVFLYLEDKSYKEIAEIIGITESNVGVKLNRIKSKLKNYFKES